MPNANVFNMAGEKVGELALSDAIFGIEPNGSVLHEAIKNHLANRRQGTQSALTRAEVSGGGKKPWRQKGTGRARSGSTRAPTWTHGGVAFAPKPRSYSYSLNKKTRRLALKSALSAKASEGEIIIIDDLKLADIKTKTMKSLLESIGAPNALVITREPDESVIKSVRNLQGVSSTIATIISPYTILCAGKLVIDKSALEKIEEVYA